MGKQSAAWSILFGGVIPIVAYSFIESYYGIIPGILAGMFFGALEIIWEIYSQKSVSFITWAGNGLILVLGGLSIYAAEGIWFKLQPAIIEFAIAIFFLVSNFFKRPVLIEMAKKQGKEIPLPLHPFFHSLSLRIGIFFLLHALLATWAAVKWSTAQWAFLKGVGFTGSFILYMALEMYVLRTRIKKNFSNNI